MKKSRTLKLTLVGLLLLITTSAGATKVKLFTVSGGLRTTRGATVSAKVIMGQPLAGRMTPAVGQSGAYFGFWELLSQTLIVSPVVDDLPPARNQLFRNYPNPFNPSTRIDFALVQEAEVRIEVYDLMGRKVDTLFEGSKPAGRHTLTYQPKNLASGAYVILMRAGSFRATQSMMLVK